MNFLSIYLVSSVFQLIKAQHPIELQFIGTEISPEEQSKADFCELPYCLLDTNYLFIAATQNKSVKPCEDFKEFALGSLIKYRIINDRKFRVAFYGDNDDADNLRLRKVLAEKINSNDTRVTKAMKNLYAKCVSSDYIRRNGVNEMREYLRSFGLKFYPEANQDDFNLSKFFEEQPAHAIYNLFQTKLIREAKHLRLQKEEFGSLDLYFSSYEELLDNMNQLYLNSSKNANRMKKDFNEISRNQQEFYKLQQSFVPDSSNEEAVYMSIEELNSLTSSLNLNWSKVINNQLVTELQVNGKIYVDSPKTIKRLTAFLVTTDKKKIADYLAYDFIFFHSELVVVYQDDNWDNYVRGHKRSLERWNLCVELFSDSMNPALMYLYFLQYNDSAQQKHIVEFTKQAEEFALKKLKSKARWNETINNDLMERVSSIKLTAGYPEGILVPEKIEEMYSNWLLRDNQSFVELALELKFNHQKVLLEPLDSEIRKLIDMTVYYTHEFKYSPYDDVLFIHAEYLHYPFYHYQRPRFFNSATVGYFFFSILNWRLSEYLQTKYNVEDFDIFADELQVAYEFYSDWLESGGKEFQLGANRLNDHQLYWVAAARVFYEKFRPQNSTEIENADEDDDEDDEHMHSFFFKKSGFREAFHCN